MKTEYDVILRPVITERSMEAIADKKYVFEVAQGAGKIEIADAVEKLFSVKVKSVNTINLPGKKKRLGVHVGTTPRRRKAIVVLTADSKPIELFEGMI